MFAFETISREFKCNTWCLLPLRYGDECPSILCSRTSERILWVKPNITRFNICMVSRCLQYDLLNTPDPNLPWICCTCIGHSYLHLHRHGLLHHWRQRLLFRSCNLRRLGGSRRCLFEAWLLGRRPCCDMCGSSMDHCWFERNYPCPNNKWLEPSHISYTIPEQYQNKSLLDYCIAELILCSRIQSTLIAQACYDATVFWSAWGWKSVTTC